MAFLFLGLLAGAGLGALVALWYARRSADTLRGEMQAAFAALSQDALQRSHTTLLQTADQALRARQEAIDALIAPVRDTLDKVQTQVARADRDREGSFQAVKTQLTTLAQAQEQKYEMRLSDLRMFIARSSYLDIVQGKDKPRQLWYRPWYSRITI